MSHFVVLVIGDDVEQQLAPYHEFECTGEDDEYVVDVEEIDKLREEWNNPSDFVKENYKHFSQYVTDYYGRPIVKPAEEVDLEGEHKYGYALMNDDSEVYSVINRTNPNAKWDWYQEGGRYSKWYYDKEGNNITSGPLKNFDFEAKMRQAENDAVTDFNFWEKMFEEHGKDAKSWDDILKMEDLSIDEKRELYNSQPIIMAFKDCEHFKHHWFFKPIEDMGYDREKYIEKCRKESITSYAVVKGGTWYQRGEMGWFGMSSNEMDRDDWDSQFHALLNGLDPETQLTVIDCHI